MWRKKNIMLKEHLKGEQAREMVHTDIVVRVHGICNTKGRHKWWSFTSTKEIFSFSFIIIEFLKKNDSSSYSSSSSAAAALLFLLLLVLFGSHHIADTQWPCTFQWNVCCLISFVCSFLRLQGREIVRFFFILFLLYRCLISIKIEELGQMSIFSWQ